MHKPAIASPDVKPCSHPSPPVAKPRKGPDGPVLNPSSSSRDSPNSLRYSSPDLPTSTIGPDRKPPRHVLSSVAERPDPYKSSTCRAAVPFLPLRRELPFSEWRACLPRHDGVRAVCYIPTKKHSPPTKSPYWGVGPTRLPRSNY